jgi:hypothetical protein
MRKEQRWGSYLVNFAPWHAPHALMSEYVTVLHLHGSVSSTPLGPLYEPPGLRGETEKAAKKTRQQDLYTQGKH